MGSFELMAALFVSGTEMNGPTPSKKCGTKWNKKGSSKPSVVTLTPGPSFGDVCATCSPPRGHIETRAPSGTS